MTLSKDAASRKDATNAYAGGFQHRHYATVAAIIKQMTSEDFEGLRPVIARHFAAELRHTNPRFDKARFLRACGVED